MKKNQPQINDDDLSAWAEITKEITKTKQPKLIEKAPIELPEIRNTVDISHVYTGDKLDSLNLEKDTNLDRRTAEKFRRGEFRIERRLDLHGYIEKDAYSAVDNFIKTAYIEGKRCVLIITGKGLPHPEDDIFTTKGLLKEKVPQWLNAPALRPMILSISHALPKDGGSGALYILLRRKRS